MTTPPARPDNATLRKFGYPESAVCDYPHWSVVLRPAQATLGALVLVATEPVQRFSALSSSAFTELGTVIAACEATLGRLFAYQRINYLMLMMVDPDVHFHVLPRYAEPRAFEGVDCTDPGWPGPPRLDHANPLSDAAWQCLRDQLRAAWPR